MGVILEKGLKVLKMLKARIDCLYVEYSLFKNKVEIPKGRLIYICIYIYIYIYFEFPPLTSNSGKCTLNAGIHRPYIEYLGIDIGVVKHSGIV